jgi:3-hydroxymyristoyl/3-hydroxydecanoyl-(acyl carrier protein) dehydratase
VLTLPQIESLERRPDGLHLDFMLPGHLEYFDGHFPQLALLPGVVQIGWAVELARSHLVLESAVLDHFRALSAVKFMRVLRPGTSVRLRLSADRPNRALEFEYRDGGVTCSTGRVLFH